MKASSGINRNSEALDSPAKMKKIVTFIVLLVFVTLNCQCRRDEDPNTRLAVYLEEMNPNWNCCVAGVYFMCRIEKVGGVGIIVVETRYCHLFWFE